MPPVYHRSTCVVCGAAGLRPVAALKETGVPHEAEGHNVAYSYRTIVKCEACGHGQLEAFSHDCWDHDDDWDLYWWYALTPATLQTLQQHLHACPAPLDPQCACALHQSLRKSADGIYGGVRGVFSAFGKVAFAWARVAQVEGVWRLEVEKGK